MDDNKEILRQENDNDKNNDIFSLHNSIKKRKKIEGIKSKKYFKKTSNKIINKIAKVNTVINNKDKNDIPIIKKERNPGIDLVRLMTMYFVVLNHFLFFGKGYDKFRRYNKQLRMLTIFTSWHNNAFGLISGIVGYKTNKYSNLSYLWLIVFFYSVGIHIYIKKYRKNFRIEGSIDVEYYPIIFNRYWYFTAYFGMYLFIPVINKGIASLSKKEFKLVVLSIVGIFAIWRDYKNPSKDIFKLSSGYSLLWLLSIYIIGAYIGKYYVIYSGLKKYIYCFICIFIYSSISYAYYKVYFNELYLGDGYYQKKIVFLLKLMLTERFDSLLFITQAITVCLFFMQIHYNKYLAKFICFLGPLAFGIYLIHIHPIIFKNVLFNIFDRDPRNLSLKSTMILVLLKPFKVTCLCIFIDCFRHLLFTLLRFRKILLFLEKILMKLMDYI